MESKLLTLPAEELLRKFGLGNHKPGSGSAAAYQGLLSAQLIRTVISLTNEEKRRDSYSEWLPDLLKIDTQVETRIYPRLEKLFQDDSIQFDKHIKLLRARDEETDVDRRKEFDKKALQELVPATEIPLEIGKLCLELGEYALFVFDHGFKSAKGDASVALNGATASAGGCLSIIDLNLSKFICNSWTIRIRSEADALRDENEAIVARAELLLRAFKASCREKSFCKSNDELRSGKWEGLRLSEKGIEQVAIQVQSVLWEYRDLIWKVETPGQLIDILSPEIAIETLLGYRFGFASLGHDVIDGVEVEVAGQINKEQRTIVIANGQRREVQNFTAAHELGHALLHKGMLLHRDRPLDGSSSVTRDFREVQANKFAAFFLMPGEQVRKIFRRLFLTERFRVNDNTVFALGEGRVSTFKAKVRSQKGLARYLASAEHFQGQAFNSMNKIFRVSIGAMAIRLEELGLVEF
jgi:formiminotetrahydrofolate cyclodeaminase